MALYHFSVKQVSRGKGQTVVNSAAYISGQKLYNDYYGQVHDYTRKSGVMFTEILKPDYVPERLSDRETLWNEVERAEKGKRAQLAYSFDIALQNELTLEENIQLAREFCQEQFVARGMIVDLAVHEGKSKDGDEPDNPHFHVLAPIRPFTEEGIWGNKQKREYVLDEEGNRIKDAKGKYVFNAVSTTGWNDPELLKEWRKAWTEKVNDKFRECHMAARIDHRSYKEQGIDLIPTIHEGYEVRAMEKKGIKTIIGELNRAIRQFNQMFISLKESIQWMKTAYEEMKMELDRRQQNPTLLESLQDYYDKKTQNSPKLSNFYAEMERRGKKISNLQEFAKSINYLQVHNIETMDDLQTRIQELNGIISASKAEISEKREQLKNLEDLEKKMQVLKQNQPLIDEYNHFFFQKRREKFYTEHKKAINYYRKCERELKPYRDKKGRLPESRWKKEKEDLRIMIEELKADNQPYQDELEKAVRQNHVRLVIIDPVQAFIGADVDMNRANEVRPVFRKLGMIAEKTSCAIVLIGHLNKSSGTQSTYRGLGSIDIMAAVRSLIFIGKVRKDPTTRVLIHEKSSLAPPGETMAFKLGDEEGFRWVGAYEISADELLDGKEGKATETKLERGAKLIQELLVDKNEISIRELDDKAKEQGISGRTMRDVRSRMKNELEYWINEKQENCIRLKV